MTRLDITLKKFQKIENNILFYLKRKLLFFYLKQISPSFLKKVPSSSIKIDVLIPAIPRDFEVLAYTVESIREYVQHPLGIIYVVSPYSEKVVQFCSHHNCQFIDEKLLLPVSKDQINYFVNGDDRSGWIYQQLLKLSGDKICTQENFLVFDADTVLIQPTVFEVDGKIIYYCSDEYHAPYFDLFSKLFRTNLKFSLSFINHYMLFNKTLLKHLKSTIEYNFNKDWWVPIINNLDITTASSFSEYETYGNFVYLNYSKSMKFSYWSNINLKRNQLDKFNELKNKLSKKYRAISFHHYDN